MPTKEQLELNADRNLMANLIEDLDMPDNTLGICSCCGKEGIILTANADDKDKTGHTREIKGCWVCVKNKKVINPTGLGFS